MLPGTEWMRTDQRLVRVTDVYPFAGSWRVHWRHVGPPGHSSATDVDLFLRRHELLRPGHCRACGHAREHHVGPVCRAPAGPCFCAGYRGPEDR